MFLSDKHLPKKVKINWSVDFGYMLIFVKKYWRNVWTFNLTTNQVKSTNAGLSLKQLQPLNNELHSKSAGFFCFGSWKRVSLFGVFWPNNYYKRWTKFWPLLSEHNRDLILNLIVNQLNHWIILQIHNSHQLLIHFPQLFNKTLQIKSAPEGCTLNSDILVHDLHDTQKTNT